MAEKKTYWLTDGYGSKALAVGVEERDRWVPRGWSETDEPADEDRVWMRHADHGGHAQFPAGVVDTWKALGWEPSAPPEPVDVLHDSQLVDVTAPAAAPTSTEPAPSGAQEQTTTRAASGAKKGS